MESRRFCKKSFNVSSRALRGDVRRAMLFAVTQRFEIQSRYPSAVDLMSARGRDQDRKNSASANWSHDAETIEITMAHLFLGSAPFGR
jgi:hypothetical protein